MRSSDFDYHLPPELIAQHPAPRRDDARLLVVDRRAGTFRHDIFRNIGAYLPGPSLLVVNDSRVIPARLLGKKALTGGRVEVFLLKQLTGRCFEAMLKPLKKIKEGEALAFAGGVSARLVSRQAGEDGPTGIVEFDCDDVLKVLEDIGHIPLPPYIRRPDEACDREDYQTVYAACNGSVAAPTAGLHFTLPLMDALRADGHAFAQVTLHVNYGTFKPVEEEDVADHRMHAEYYRMPGAAQQALRQARDGGRTIVAVGTTSCRTLEAFARSGKPEGETDIFLYPGARFGLTGALVTNFHLPRSTLLMLVAAFAGVELCRRAYEEAVRERYRFYSYGDAMIVL
jgi:S-adenosylmethionine:tRNA ribosyltransferase-isomerase